MTYKGFTIKVSKEARNELKDLFNVSERQINSWIKDEEQDIWENGAQNIPEY